MQNIAILDDVVEEAIATKQLLLPYFEKRNMAIDRIDMFQNGAALLSFDTHYDMLFLDIEVGEENGIEIGKQLRKHHADMIIIVTTSYVKYSMEGYKIQAARYLLKPLHASLLYSELDEVLQGVNATSILVKSNHDTIRLDLKNMYYIESYGRHSRIATKQGIIPCDHAIGWWAARVSRLPFMECYKGIIVHLQYIKDIRKDVLHMENQQSLPIARRRIEALKQAWLKQQEQEL